MPNAGAGSLYGQPIYRTVGKDPGDTHWKLTRSQWISLVTSELALKMQGLLLDRAKGEQVLCVPRILPWSACPRMNTHPDTQEVQLPSIQRIRGGKGTAGRRRRKSGLKYLACAMWAGCLCPLNVPCWNSNPQRWGCWRGGEGARSCLIVKVPIWGTQALWPYSIGQILFSLIFFPSPKLSPFPF